MFSTFRMGAPLFWATLIVSASSALATAASAQTQPPGPPPSEAQTPPPAEADPPGYREAVDKAVAELERDNYEEARALFWRAHAIMPNARIMRGLGIAEFGLRNYGECIRHLEAALASPVRPLDEGLRADAKELLSRANDFVARFTLDTRPRATQVMLDGIALNVPEGQPLLLQVGDHVIEVHAHGYQPERVRLSVKGGESDTLTVLFTKPIPSEPPRDARARPLRRNPWLWTAVGVVVAGAATGTAIALGSRGRERAPIETTTGVVLGAP